MANVRQSRRDPPGARQNGEGGAARDEERSWEARETQRNRSCTTRKELNSEVKDQRGRERERDGGRQNETEKKQRGKERY